MGCINTHARVACDCVKWVTPGLLGFVNTQVLEVDAHASVQDMIHAAIHSYGATATLREVCAVNWRLAALVQGASHDRPLFERAVSAAAQGCFSSYEM